MSNMYVGVEGIARKVKAMYIGVDGIARKVKKGYVGVDGVARCFYSGDPVVYTGAYTISTVTDTSGNARTLYTLTGSGTLTVAQDTEYWMCGGGGNGSSASTTTASGGGGGGGYATSGTLPSGNHTITIGAAQGASSIIKSDNTVTMANAGVTPTNYNGGAGGSGGGAGATGGSYISGSVGTGSEVSTYPFGITSLYAHCAGGAGGAHMNNVTTATGRKGGGGGTNGGDGKTGATVSVGTAISGGVGGAKGGGTGGTSAYAGSGTFTTSAGGAATFYGSGGGGYATVLSIKNSSSGSGYQGVVYLLI